MEELEYRLMQEFENHHWWFVGRRKIISEMISTLHLPEKAQILEIGCGSGGNFEMLSEFGEIYAVEVYEDAIKNARTKNIAKEIVMAELPEETLFNDKKFDLIVFLDALEHMEKDVESLQAVKDLLDDNGVLLITVPAFQFLWSGHDIACHHKRRYSRNTLKNTIQSAGYKFSYASYYNFFLFPLICAIRALQKISNKELQPKSDLKMPNIFFNWILKKIFGFERIFIKNLSLPFGLSLMATATK